MTFCSLSTKRKVESCTKSRQEPQDSHYHAIQTSTRHPAFSIMNHASCPKCGSTISGGKTCSSCGATCPQ
ncbi:hypothetical protein BDV97DRAFT_353326 [Delphinella strobiligena]|nr:hypothetical protein BDV97DRAFT_353326 [Delphinella strobiligena]